MVNAAGSPTFYEFDSTDLLQLYKEMDQNDEEPVVVYHSHTATEAYPSRTDIGLASEPGRTLCAGQHAASTGITRVPWSSGPTGSSTAR